MTHQTVVDFVGYYGESTRLAQEAGLPFIMFETNTGSCGGFPGISQSYGASLWILDYGFQMANYNFSNALLHIGGQNVYYNVRLFTLVRFVEADWDGCSPSPVCLFMPCVDGC